MAATTKRRPPKKIKPPMNPHRYAAWLTSQKSRIDPTPMARITPTMPNQNFAPSPSSTSSPLPSSYRSSRSKSRSTSSQRDECALSGLCGRGCGRRVGDGRRRFLFHGGCQASPRQVARDVDCRGGQWSSEDKAEHAEDAAGSDRNDEHHQRIEIERRAHRERLDDVL